MFSLPRYEAPDISSLATPEYDRLFAPVFFAPSFHQECRAHLRFSSRWRNIDISQPLQRRDIYFHMPFFALPSGFAACRRSPPENIFRRHFSPDTPPASHFDRCRVFSAIRMLIFFADMRCRRHFRRFAARRRRRKRAAPLLALFRRRRHAAAHFSFRPTDTPQVITAATHGTAIATRHCLYS